VITSEEIKSKLWNGANELRGSMDASRYKDYMLGLMFYKFLSDKTLETFKMAAGIESATEEELIDEYLNSKKELGEQLEKMIQNVLGYFVSPEYLYQMWLRDIKKGDFEVQKVTDSLNTFERTIVRDDGENDFKGLFSSSTLDLTDTALGSNLHERSENIKALIQIFADFNMVELQKGDVLGTAYEYLIGQFAMESGKKAGEFYTPHMVSEVMGQIVAKTTNINSIYDPTVGSGSLLLTVNKHLNKNQQRDLSYYGQEKNTATYNLTRMNLLLHGVRPEKMTIKNGDTLANDWPEDPKNPNEGVQFDAVVMNPPYSLSNWNKAGLKVSDPRFEIAGILPPDSKGDYAFLLHGLYHLATNGTMAIVLPHGVLFRGSSEGEIRKRLIDKNRIDAIIGLPSNLFTNTGIPVVIVILKKNRAITDPILMLDASNNFKKEGKQNVLQEKDIAKIVDTYISKTEIKGFSHCATREEIIQNEYNMNIPRYVKAIETGIAHDVDAHLLGGIPKHNIVNLSILNSIVPNILNNSFSEIREGYIVLEKSINDLSEEVLSSEQVVKISSELEIKISKYIDKYWNILVGVDSDINIYDLEEEMLNEIKLVLSDYSHIDEYEGYQIIAEIWKNHLWNDTELIVNQGFYEVGRRREPNILTKGTGKKKSKEQYGWKGSLVPNQLIAEVLYSNDLNQLNIMRNSINEIEMELSESIEAAKIEGSRENEVLSCAIKKNKDGELGDSFDKQSLKEALKLASKNSEEFTMLMKAEDLLSRSTSKAKELKKADKELRESVQDRIMVLTDEEIELLVFRKWFGDTKTQITNLINATLKSELKTIEELNERYADTLDAIDQQIDVVSQDFELLINDLAVTL